MDGGRFDFSPYKNAPAADKSCSATYFREIFSKPSALSIWKGRVVSGQVWNSRLVPGSCSPKTPKLNRTAASAILSPGDVVCRHSGWKQVVPFIRGAIRWRCGTSVPRGHCLLPPALLLHCWAAGWKHAHPLPLWHISYSLLLARSLTEGWAFSARSNHGRAGLLLRLRNRPGIRAVAAA